MGFKKTSLVAIAVVATLVAANTSAQVRGVTKDEILLGSHIDLSGPIAELGRAGVNAGKSLRIVARNSGWVNYDDRVVGEEGTPGSPSYVFPRKRNGTTAVGGHHGQGCPALPEPPSLVANPDLPGRGAGGSQL